ncbi:hypothetical protein OBV_01200 [Oscillibacter valericigenes Sjm18-20]|nr:hypothetical protein OBV_01200 [Oscillibacter valericigenes Sjm18-20]
MKRLAVITRSGAGIIARNGLGNMDLRLLVTVVFEMGEAQLPSAALQNPLPVLLPNADLQRLQNLKSPPSMPILCSGGTTRPFEVKFQIGKAIVEKRIIRIVNGTRRFFPRRPPPRPWRQNGTPDGRPPEGCRRCGGMRNETRPPSLKALFSVTHFIGIESRAVYLYLCFGLRNRNARKREFITEPEAKACYSTNRKAKGVRFLWFSDLEGSRIRRQTPEKHWWLTKIAAHKIIPVRL